MLSIFYEFCLVIFALYAFPKMLFHMWTQGKYRSSLGQKFGRGFPSIDKQGRPLIWIHAVSVGETKAVAALVKKLKNVPEKPLILISSSTETGHADAKKTISFADYHVYLPFDFRGIIKPIIEKVKPDLVILCETDLWYNFLKFAKKQQARIVVVNGKISERSMKRFLLIPFFSRNLFGLIDLFCIQSSHYLQRFEKLGIGSSKLLVTGNIKFDDEHSLQQPAEIKALKKRLSLKDGDRVVVIGSSHDPEEDELLDSLKPVMERISNLKVLIVPRHPERFEAVATLIKSKGFSLHRYSATNTPLGEPRVILVDTMGQLRNCYQIADVAIVAGSFTPKVGGHNILEPLYYGVPSIFGPHMHSQPELLELIKGYGAGIQTEAVEVGAAVERLYDEPLRRQALIEAGSKLVCESRGATQRTCEVIARLLENAS